MACRWPEARLALYKELGGRPQQEICTQNWRAKPLVSYRVIVDRIAATTTKTGLKVYCELDANSYPKGIVVSNDEMKRLNIQRADFHGEWNYTIAPSAQLREAFVF
jgi:hypothetical protein